MDNKIKTTIILPEELREKLRAEADSQHRSMHNLILSILWDYFKKDKPPM